MSSSSTSGFPQQTGTTNPSSEPESSTPPLLPAFLITGLLLAAIVAIIIWRHLLERRNARLDRDDPTWPADGYVGGNGGGAKGPTPKLWELQFASESARALWADIMPLSVTPLRSVPKPRRPRFLVPSDRPVTLLQRMFGGERRQPRSDAPPISVLQPTSSTVLPCARDDEDHVDRMQVAVLISFPHRRRVRRSSYPPGQGKRISDTPSLPPEKCSLKNVGEESEAESSCQDKGKKRSLDTPLSMLKGYYDYDDDEGPLEVAFGTTVLPFED